MTLPGIDCDVIRTSETEQVRHGDDVYTSSFLSPYMDSLCHVGNKILYVLSWRSVSVLTRVLFRGLFPSLLRSSGNKRQNNTLVSADIVRHSSTYIILYVLLRLLFFDYDDYCLCSDESWHIWVITFTQVHHLPQSHPLLGCNISMEIHSCPKCNDAGILLAAN